MTLRSFSKVCLLATAICPALLHAQSDTSAKEDERMDVLAREQGAWAAPKHRFSVGVRILSSGAKVDFQNLGSVPSNFTISPVSEGLKNRSYTDGTVSVDSLSSNEKDANGNQTSTPGGRYDVYSTDLDGNQILSGNYLSYTPGLTRQWTALSETQLAQMPGYVAFNIYSTTSDGVGASNKQGATGGVEFQLTRDIGRGSRYFQWSVLTGISLTDINGKTAGSISATLNTYTDYYSLNGLTVPTNQLVNPSTVGITVNDGGVDRTVLTEFTVPLSNLPDSTLSTDTAVAGGAAVNGRWQVKGAYMMVKLGPSLRTQLTDRLGLTASVGLAGGFAGTRYTASESFTVASLPDTNLELIDTENGSTVVGSTTTKFLTGYFADVNLEWAANDAMGIFGGFSAQQLSDYEQKLGDRRARIDIGNSVGIRGGVSIRF
jgi:hypothetical protein